LYGREEEERARRRAALRRSRRREAHLSWKKRLDGYCACTAIVKEEVGRRGRQAENEKRMGGGLAQRAGGRSRRRKLPLVVLIALLAAEEPSPIPRTHFARSLLKTSSLFPSLASREPCLPRRRTAGEREKLTVGGRRRSLVSRAP
jgi:hypothetical protein